MDTNYWHMNATQGGANLHPAQEQICVRVQIAHMNTALVSLVFGHKNLSSINIGQ